MSDPRVEKTKKKVLAAAQQLLGEYGYRGVTIEALSEQSGVAKTSIYRHWEDAADVMTQAYSEIILQPIDGHTGSLQGDFQVILSALAYKMHDPKWTVAVTGMLEAALTDSAMQDLHTEFIQQIHEPLSRALNDARERGELAEFSADAQLITSLVGPIMYAGLVVCRPLDPILVPELIANALQSIKEKE